MSDCYYDEDFEVDDDGIFRDTKSDGGIIIDDDGIVRDEGDRLSHQTQPDSGLGGERKSSTSTINYKLQGRHIPTSSYLDDSVPMEEKSLHISDLEDSQQEFSFDQASLGSRDIDALRSENNLHTTSEDMFSDLCQVEDLDKHFPRIYAEKLRHKELQGYDGDEEFDEPGILEEFPPRHKEDEDFPIYSPIASRHNSQKRTSQSNNLRDKDTLYLLPQHLSDHHGNSLLDSEQLEAHLKADSVLAGTDEIDPIQQYLLGLEQQEAYEDSVSMSERSDLLKPSSNHHSKDRQRERELDKEVRRALSEAVFTEDEEEESLGYDNVADIMNTREFAVGYDDIADICNTQEFGEAMALLSTNPQNQSTITSPPASRKSTPLPGSSRIPVYSRSPSPTRPVLRDKTPSNSRPDSRLQESSTSHIHDVTKQTRGSARLSSPTRIPTPTRGQSPARNSSPVRPVTPSRGQSPTRIPTPTRLHSPTHAPTARGNSPTRATTPMRTCSPTRLPTPARGRSPTRISTAARVQSPTRIPSPVRGRSPRVTSPVRGATPTRLPTPTRGLAIRQSKSGSSEDDTNGNLHKVSSNHFSYVRRRQLPSPRQRTVSPSPSIHNSQSVPERSHTPSSNCPRSPNLPAPRPESPTSASVQRSKSPEASSNGSTSQSQTSYQQLQRLLSPNAEEVEQITSQIPDRVVSPSVSEGDLEGDLHIEQNGHAGSERTNSEPLNWRSDTDSPSRRTHRSGTPGRDVLRTESPNVASLQRSHSPKVENKSAMNKSQTSPEQLERLLLSPNAQEVEQITSQDPDRAKSPRVSENNLRADQNEKTRSMERNLETVNQRADTDSPSRRTHRSKSPGLNFLRTKSPALSAYLSGSPGPNSKRTKSPSLRGYMSPLTFGGNGGISELVGARSCTDINYYNENSSSSQAQSCIKESKLADDHNKGARSGVSDIPEQNDCDEAEENEGGQEFQAGMNNGSRAANGINDISDVLSYKLLTPSSGRPDTPKSFKIRTQNNGALTKGPVKATVDTLPDITLYESDDHSSHTSEKSRGELSVRLRQEHQQRREANQLVHQLQQDYDELLAKHAGAELTIDQLRLEAKINLHMEPPAPTTSIMGSLSSAQHPQTINLGHSSRASVISLGGAHAQTQHGVVSDASGLGVKGNTRLTMNDSAAGPDGSFQADGLADNSLTATGNAESMKMGLMFQSEGMREKLDSFQILLQENQLTPEEQEKVYGKLKSELEQIQNEYRQACDNHDMIRRQGMLTSGGTDAGFDDDRTLSGGLFQLERKLDELHEHVEDNQKANRSQRLPFQESTSASQTPVVSRAATPKNDTGSPSILDLMSSDVDPEIEARVQQLHREYGILMERYQKLKERPRTPARDKDIDVLIDKLKRIYEESPADRKPKPVPPELEDRLREQENAVASSIQEAHDASTVPSHSERGANRDMPSSSSRIPNRRGSDSSFVGEEEWTFGAAASALPSHMRRERKYPRRQLDVTDSSVNSPYQKRVVGTLDDRDSGYTESSRLSTERGTHREPRRQSRSVRGQLTFGEDSTDSMDVPTGQSQAGHQSQRHRPASGSLQSERSRSTSRRRNQNLRDSRRLSDPNSRGNDESLLSSDNSVSELSESFETSAKVKTLESEVQNLQQQISLASMHQSAQPNPAPYTNINQPHQYPQAGAYSYAQYPGYQGYDNTQYTAGHYPHQQPAHNNNGGYYQNYYYGYYGNQNDGNYDNNYNGQYGEYSGAGQYPYQQQSGQYGQPDGYSYQNGHIQPSHESLYATEPGQWSQTPAPYNESIHTTRRSIHRSHSFSGRPTHPSTEETYHQQQPYDDQVLRAPSRAHFYDEPLRNRSQSYAHIYDEPALRAPPRAHFERSDTAYDCETDRQTDYTQTEWYSEYQSDYPTHAISENRDYYLGRSRARSRERSTSGDRQRRSSSRGSRSRSAPRQRYGNGDYYRLSYADEDYNQGAAPVSHQDWGYSEQPVYYHAYDRPQTSYHPAPYTPAAVPPTLHAAHGAAAAAAPVPVVSTSNTVCPMCGGQGLHSHTDYIYPQPATATPSAGPVRYVAPASSHVSFAQSTHSSASVPVVGQAAQPAVLLVSEEPARGHHSTGGNVRYYVREYEDLDAAPEPERRSRSARRTRSLPRNNRRRNRRDDESDDAEDTDLEGSLIEVTRTAVELKHLSQRMQHNLTDELDTSYHQAYHTKYL